MGSSISFLHSLFFFSGFGCRLFVTRSLHCGVAPSSAANRAAALGCTPPSTFGRSPLIARRPPQSSPDLLWFLDGF
jgi:hypothetical protein